MRAVIFGCSGPVGLGLMEHLAAAGSEVVGVSRRGRADAPAGVRVIAADAADPEAAARCAAGADVIFATLGLPYPEWEAGWPPIVEGLLTAAQRTTARLVFADNMYAYGPTDAPLREDLPLTTVGRTPALRARMTRRFLDAHASGRARVALVRASDFYGPRARYAQLGERVFARLLAGRPAQVVGSLDQPHSFTYVPDFVRALATVGADDTASGEIWHVPNAPAVSLRQIAAQLTPMLGRPARMTAMPQPLLSLLALITPTMRVLAEMVYQFERPFLVDHAKYAARFGEAYTPLDVGLRATLDWYRHAA